MGSMQNRGWMLRVLVMTMLLSLSACDPAIFYGPQDWSLISRFEWEESFGSVQFKVSPLGGLCGMRATYLENYIKNESSVEEVCVEKVIIDTGRGSYSAQVDSRPIAPGQGRNVGVFWEFNEPIVDVLVDPIVLNVTIRVGAEQRVLRIPMRRYK